jgi:hypothetical protein
MKIPLTITALAFLCFAGLTAQQPRPGPEHRVASSMQRKLDHIKQNGEQRNPDQAPTVMTEEEINDYIVSGGVKLPVGVKRVRLEGQSGLVTGQLTVDFDEIRAGIRSSNPLLSIFSGVHSVRVEVDASGSGGTGRVHVRSVSIDGTEVPRFLLELFVAKFLTPKYPTIGLDSAFKLPNRIDAATVGYHKLTVTQR